MKRAYPRNPAKSICEFVCVSMAEKGFLKHMENFPYQNNRTESKKNIQKLTYF